MVGEMFIALSEFIFIQGPTIILYILKIIRGVLWQCLHGLQTIEFFLKFKILYYPALYTAKESLEPILEN